MIENVNLNIQSCYLNYFLDFIMLLAFFKDSIGKPIEIAECSHAIQIDAMWLYFHVFANAMLKTQSCYF